METVLDLCRAGKLPITKESHRPRPQGAGPASPAHGVRDRAFPRTSRGRRDPARSRFKEFDEGGAGRAAGSAEASSERLGCPERRPGPTREAPGPRPIGYPSSPPPMSSGTAPGCSTSSRSSPPWARRTSSRTWRVCRISANLDPEACYAWWEILVTRPVDENAIRDIFIFVEDQAELRRSRRWRTRRERRPSASATSSWTAARYRRRTFATPSARRRGWVRSWSRTTSFEAPGRVGPRRAGAPQEGARAQR